MIDCLLGNSSINLPICNLPLHKQTDATSRVTVFNLHTMAKLWFILFRSWGIQGYPPNATSQLSGQMVLIIPYFQGDGMWGRGRPLEALDHQHFLNYKKLVVLQKRTNMYRIPDLFSLPWAPKTMKNKGFGFGHLKTRLFTIKTSKNVGFGGPKLVVPLSYKPSVPGLVECCSTSFRWRLGGLELCTLTHQFRWLKSIVLSLKLT